MKGSILVVENYPGRGACITRLLRQFEVPYNLVTVNGAPLSLPQKTVGVIVSGGPQSARKIKLDGQDKLSAVLRLLDAIEERQLPVLGICLGHQLMGVWAGGKVEKLPFKVTGFREVELNKRSKIFPQNLQQRISVFQYHEDYISKLPDNCEILASSNDCKVEAFKIRDRLMWGVQFHPEVTLSDGEAIFDEKPLPLQLWNPKSDVKAPFIIKSFATVCREGE